MKSLSVRDAYAEEGLKYVRCNKAFFSCDGFDFGGGVTTAFVAEARVTDSMLNVASEVVLLADSTKLGKNGFGKICDMSRVDILITDNGIPQSVARTGERVLPVDYEDNYISLIPGRERKITVSFDTSSCRSGKYELYVEGWNVPRTRIRFAL